MVMLLTFGYAIGISKPCKNFFNYIAKYIDKPWKVYLSILFTALTLMLLNWGLIPMAALFAIEVCKRVKNVDYRLACASLYCGILVWHGGLSASAPLMMATQETAQLFIDQGIISNIIPISETLLIPTNLALIVTCYFSLPLIFFFLTPKKVPEKFDAQKHYQKEEINNHQELDNEFDQVDSLAHKLNHSPIINIALAILSLIGFGILISSRGFNLTSLVILMFAAGVLLHWHPMSYVNAMKEAVKGTADIILQYPLFGGIMNIFISTGLAMVFANSLVQFATEFTLPFFAFVIAAIVNLFIPSGGSEWLVLGAPLLEAAKLTGAHSGKTIISFAYGDALTNLINPFWTLVFLPIMRKLMDIQARDFMGYTVLVCVILFLLESLVILLI